MLPWQRMLSSISSYENSSCRKRSLACQSTGLRSFMDCDRDSVGPPSPLSLATDVFWRRLGRFSCLPTLIVIEIRFLWIQAFCQAQKDRRSWKKKRCSALVSSPDPVLSLSIFRLSPFACKRFWKAWELRGLIPQQNGLQGWTTQDA